MIFKIIFFLSSKERVKALLLLAMILIMALLDAIGVASIMPFMAVLTNPDLINTNRLLDLIYKRLGTNSQGDFLLILGIFTFLWIFQWGIQNYQ